MRKNLSGVCEVVVLRGAQRGRAHEQYRVNQD